MKKGFTVLEVIVVIAIVLILCALLIPAFYAASEASANNAAKEKLYEETGNSRVLTVEVYDEHEYIIYSAKRHEEGGICHKADCKKCEGR